MRLGKGVLSIFWILASVILFPAAFILGGQTLTKTPPLQNQEVMNGNGNGSFNQFDISFYSQLDSNYDLNWTTRQSMPTSRSWASSAVYDRKIYVVGGCSCESGSSQFENAVNVLEVYDPERDEWEVLTPMSVNRVGPAAAVLNSKLYVFGGFNPNTWSFNPSVEIYDFKTNTWSMGNSMPTGRSWSQAVVFKDKIYVLGGVGDYYYDICEVYDPSTDSWETRASFRTGRYLHAAVATDNAIYVIGGSSWSTGSDRHFSDIQKYNPEEDTWTKKADMPIPYDHIDAFTLTNKIWLMGGGNHSLVYDIQSDTWEIKSSDQHTENSYCVSCVSDVCYRFGGGGWGPTLDTVESVDLEQYKDESNPDGDGQSQETDKIWEHEWFWAAFWGGIQVFGYFIILIIFKQLK
jgi:N-acetylneuraminic acid mutarotase